MHTLRERESTCALEMDITAGCITNTDTAALLRSQSQAHVASGVMTSPAQTATAPTTHFGNSGLADIWRVERERLLHQQGNVPADFGTQPTIPRVYCGDAMGLGDQQPPELHGASLRSSASMPSSACEGACSHCLLTDSEEKAVAMLNAALASDAPLTSDTADTLVATPPSSQTPSQDAKLTRFDSVERQSTWMRVLQHQTVQTSAWFLLITFRF